jgi:hypothetical protein
MARNLDSQHRLDTNAIFNQKVIPIYGPNPVVARRKVTIFYALCRRPWLLLFILLSVGFGLQQLWATTGYQGLGILLRWRLEILAGSLSLLVIFLWGKFRRWEQARPQQRARRTQDTQEKVAGEKTPHLPPTLPAKPQAKQEEFTLVIDYWASGEPVRLSEQHADLAQLPDEFIAPDALVLNFQFTERLS